MARTFRRKVLEGVCFDAVSDQDVEEVSHVFECVAFSRC